MGQERSEGLFAEAREIQRQYGELMPGKRQGAIAEWCCCRCFYAFSCGGHVFLGKGGVGERRVNPPSVASSTGIWSWAVLGIPSTSDSDCDYWLWTIFPAGVVGALIKIIKLTATR
jgi:hypothetical protein